MTPGAHVVEGQTRDGHAVRQSQNVEAGDIVSVALVPSASTATTAAPPPPPPPAPAPGDGRHGLVARRRVLRRRA